MLNLPKDGDILWKAIGRHGMYIHGPKYYFYAPEDINDACYVLGGLVDKYPKLREECLNEDEAAEYVWNDDPSFQEEYASFEDFLEATYDSDIIARYLDCYMVETSKEGFVYMLRVDHIEPAEDEYVDDIATRQVYAKDSARPRRFRSSRVRDSRFSRTARFRRGQKVEDNFTTAGGIDVDELIDYLKSLADNTYVTSIMASGKYYIDLLTQDFGGVGFVEIKNMDVRTQYHLDWRGLKKFLQKNLGQYVEFDLRDASVSQNAGRKY